jgi:hypothetical protein
MNNFIYDLTKHKPFYGSAQLKIANVHQRLAKAPEIELNETRPAAQALILCHRETDRQNMTSTYSVILM